ncbi:MAG TPA: trypsin-like peptidase domain-containing protein [Ktedonobacteraceae bacterium]|nr:trypsin-like peptidase domain-containing protein [Ktedonobacteraceae bacterium]
MQNKDTLPYLLTNSVARLEVNGGTDYGTGFFVGSGYLLTCAHVVKAANQGQGSLKVEWNRRKYSATIEQVTEESYPDLALLKIDGLADHPCVYLADTFQLNDDLYTYGYPLGPTKGDSIISKYTGPADEPQTLLTLGMSNIRPGFSGGPLLNLRTGAVCGVIKRTIAENTLLGGRGVSIAQALEMFPTLKTMQEQFHRQNQQWISSLTPEQRQLNGADKLTLRKEPVTLFFSYQANSTDQKWVEKLQKQLITWQRRGEINAWHIGELEAGEEWGTLSTQRLDSAQIILLLVSPDYIFDEDLYKLHVERAMERRAAREAQVIPILVRPTAGWEDTLFGGLVPTPRNGKPMSKWTDDDEASQAVAEDIIKVVRGLRSPKN